MSLLEKGKEIKMSEIEIPSAFLFHLEQLFLPFTDKMPQPERNALRTECRYKIKNVMDLNNFLKKTLWARN